MLPWLCISSLPHAVFMFILPIYCAVQASWTRARSWGCTSLRRSRRRPSGRCVVLYGLTCMGWSIQVTQVLPLALPARTSGHTSPCLPVDPAHTTPHHTTPHHSTPNPTPSPRPTPLPPQALATDPNFIRLSKGAYSLHCFHADKPNLIRDPAHKKRKMTDFLGKHACS